MPKRIAIAIALLLTVAVATVALASEPPPAAFAPGRVIIKYSPDATAAEKAAIRTDLGGTVLKTLSLIDAEVLEVQNYSVDGAVERYMVDDQIAYIEPDYLVTVFETPNDPMFGQLWGLDNTGQTGGTAGADIDALRAWDVFTGSEDILVVVIDTGTDYGHPDIAANAWTNPGEIPANGIDDDGNGFIDDVHGWDFYNDDSDPMDDHGHGTHCAGTIGAVGNNGIGVVGVNWTVTIMACKFLSSGGSGSTSDAIDAITYAVMMGVDVMSNSWGGGGYSEALEDAIEAAYAAGIMFVAAAGNGSSNTDTYPHYPSSYPTGNIISVAATDHNDDLASFSNYGLVSVDLAAPGDDIYSTFPGNSYGTLSGTSMATPHVAGAAALVMGRFPAMNADQVKALILNSVDVLPSLTGKCASEGRLNVFSCIAEPDSIPPAAIDDLAASNPASNTMDLDWTATGDDGYTGSASYYDVRYSTMPLDEGNFFDATRDYGAPDPGPSGTPEHMMVTGLDFSTTYYFALKAIDEYGNYSDISNLAMGTTLGIPDIDVDPTSLAEDLISGGVALQTLTVYNVGEGTLDFEIPQPTLILGTTVMGDYLDVPKGAVDPRAGDPVIDGQGGPDATGYRWIDSDEPGGPTFTWVDITGVGTLVSMSSDDQNTGPYPIGFDFEFYGNTYDSFNICTNGFISFTSTSTAYSNQPLPNVGAPANLVAPFWDDLNFSSVDRAYYYYDGTRLIVEYHDVPHYSVGGNYTFEVILYPDGTIVYQYLTMGDPTNSATVGIQNAAMDDGLQVVFNADYIHDNLAVKIAKMPQWVALAPNSGRVYASGSFDITVAFGATGLLGGDYEASIVIESNDPDENPVTVPVTLHVTGAPDISVNPIALDFGEVFIGATVATNVVVSNPGTDNLTISGITSDNADFWASPTSFTLAPRQAQLVAVSFLPSVAGPIAGTLTIESDDPDERFVDVTAQGVGLIPPQFDVDPDEVYADLMTGESEEDTLTITNNGGSDLDFTASVELYVSGIVEQGEYVEYGKEEFDPSSSGPQTEGSGGPDVFGYSWTDSDEPGGPVFDWVEISGIGTPMGLTGDDQNVGPFPIGFDFSFYGNTFSQFYACSNGWVSFTSTKTSLTNYELPNAGYSVPENLLAPWWDDLRFTYGGESYYYYDGTRLIIEYKDVPRYSSGGPYTFEIILYPNGTVVFQYLAMDATGGLNRATIGIQNEARDDGLTVVHNADYVHDNLAVRFASVPEWLSVQPAGGTVPAGGSMELVARFNAADLFGGDYLGAIHIDSNDPNVPRYDVPAHLHVTGAPDIAAVPDNIDFGMVYLGLSTVRQFEIVNQGTDLLTVTDIVTGSPEYSVGTTSFTVEPLGSQLINLSYAPSAVGDRSSILTIYSDDPDEPELVMPLAGTCLAPPEIVVTPTALTDSLFTGELSSHTVTVENTGDSDLDFMIAVALAADVVPGDFLEVPKGEEDPRSSGPQLLGTGGPDNFGYTWVDSDEPGGPVFNWVDITTVGTLIELDGDDNSVGPLPIGFDFPFYGNDFSQFYICTNGFISFTCDDDYYSNQPLPNDYYRVCENLLAPWWDDLRIYTGDYRTYYYYDGARCIIEFFEVSRLSSSYPGTFTFEVILYPNGKIVYQYLAMVGEIEDATIGIQNDLKDDGLTVVFNDAYMHDNLAIELAFSPDWLSVSPTEGTLPPGMSQGLNVLFNASELYGGWYYGSIDILSNDPYNGLVSVDASLHVTGAPDIAVDPAALDFGWLYISLVETLTVDVSNTGTDLLQVTSLTIDHPEFTTDLTPFDLNPRESRTLEVVYTPVTEGMVSGTLTLYSNDADEPEVYVPLMAEGVVPPEIEVDPDTLRAAAMQGMVVTRNLRIMNEGGSDLTYGVGLMQIDAVPVYEYLEVPKYEEDPRPGIPAIDGTGGPDAFGYKWIDSDEPGGPTYDWVEISGVGTPIFEAYYDDGNMGPLDIGFDFPFYGTDFSQFRVCSNGWLSFTSTSTQYSNQPLPNSGAPENLLAVFWDDMVVDPSDGNEVFYYNDGSRLIVQYEIRRIAGFTPPYYSFQILLYPNGKIVYQYRQFGTTTNSATIGIQNAAQDDGLMVVFNDDYVHPDLAIEFSAGPEWLTVYPEAGVIPAGGYEDLTVSFDATELEDGLYEGVVSVMSNDLDEPVVHVPAFLTVDWTAATFMDINPNTLNLGSNGKWIDCKMGIPMEFDPMLLLGDEAFLVAGDDTLTPPERFSIEECDTCTGYFAHFKWSRSAVQSMLSEGQDVEIMVACEVQDINWLLGYDYITVINPKMNHPNGGEAFDQGENLIVMWEPPTLDTPDSYAVIFSADGGETWTEMASGITTQSVILDVPDIETEQALIRVFALKGDTPIGYDTSDGVFTIKPATGAGIEDQLPQVFALRQNWPNPFMGTTMLHFDIPKDVDVSLQVFDVQGRLVKSLVDQSLPAGRYDLGWDGCDHQGDRVASGVYFYRIQAGQWKETKRMVIVR